MRTGIQQFRAALTDRANQTVLMRGYRELARRPVPAGSRAGVEWATWPPAAAGSAGDWGPWAATPAAARFGEWGQWSGAPAPSA